MDAQAVDMEVLSINPFWYGSERDLAGQIVKLQNEENQYIPYSEYMSHLRDLYESEISLRMAYFISRHGLMDKFLKEDAAGQR